MEAGSFSHRKLTLVPRTTPLMRPRLVLALVVPAVLGCDGVTGTDLPDLPATYVLEAPGVLSDGGGRVNVVADTLHLLSGGKAERSVAWIAETSTGPQTVRRTRDPYAYALNGASIGLSYVCGPTELCAPPPHLRGEFRDGALVLRGSPDLHYRRLN